MGAPHHPGTDYIYLRRLLFVPRLDRNAIWLPSATSEGLNHLIPNVNCWLPASVGGNPTGWKYFFLQSCARRARRIHNRSPIRDRPQARRSTRRYRSSAVIDRSFVWALKPPLDPVDLWRYTNRRGNLIIQPAGWGKMKPLTRILPILTHRTGVIIIGNI